MRRVLAAAAAFLCTVSSWGWNAEGHMVVAQIAYNHLDPAVKAECDALIAVPLTYSSTGTNTFVTAAVWADDFKSMLGTGIWHYYDIPISLDGSTTAGVTVESFDVVQALDLCIATLQDTGASQADKATALRYLLHFVGDIHQPLHCSTAVWSTNLDGDAGGNQFNISGTYSNLHSMWDAGGGEFNHSLSRPLSTGSQTTLDGEVASIEASYPFTAAAGTIPDPMDWAVEGQQVAATVTYVGVTRGTTPSVSYTNTAKTTSRQRAARGGERLANLLNTIFAATPVAVSGFELE